MMILIIQFFTFNLKVNPSSKRVRRQVLDEFSGDGADYDDYDVIEDYSEYNDYFYPTNIKDPVTATPVSADYPVTAFEEGNPMYSSIYKPDSLPTAEVVSFYFFIICLKL